MSTVKTGPRKPERVGDITQEKGGLKGKKNDARAYKNLNMRLPLRRVDQEKKRTRPEIGEPRNRPPSGEKTVVNWFVSAGEAAQEYDDLAKETRGGKREGPTDADKGRPYATRVGHLEALKE